jgi:hypothetical protein
MVFKERNALSDGRVPSERVICGKGDLYMLRHIALAIAVLIVAPIFATFQPAIVAQQPKCLHGANETPDHLARRRLALTWMRRIHSLQTQYFSQRKTYQPLSALPDIQTPPGFSNQLIIHATGYAMSAKDKLDPCSFAYFSDQEQVIYAAQAIQ